MRAAREGCVMTWPSPIGSGPSAYACSAYSGKTNSCLGTVRKALSTRWSITPEERINSSTRACLAFAKGSTLLIEIRKLLAAAGAILEHIDHPKLRRYIDRLGNLEALDELP